MKIVTAIWNADPIPAELYRPGYEIWLTNRIPLDGCMAAARLVANYMTMMDFCSIGDMKIQIVKRNIEGPDRGKIQLGAAVYVDDEKLSVDVKTASRSVISMINIVRKSEIDKRHSALWSVVNEACESPPAIEEMREANVISKVQDQFSRVRLTRPIEIDTPDAGKVRVFERLTTESNTPASETFGEFLGNIKAANFNKNTVTIAAADGRTLSNVNISNGDLMKNAVNHGLQRAMSIMHIRTVTANGKRPRHELMNLSVGSIDMEADILHPQSASIANANS